MYIPKEQVPIAVVYTINKGLKKYIKVFTTLKTVDPIISPRSTKLPSGAVIHDIGVGSIFEERYKNKHSIKHTSK
jgi:hypothetical protein|tara:strand:- start:1208 stop:1432 length:225 start_codon:yes stop_codon:yes gene_type:complete